MAFLVPKSWHRAVAASQRRPLFTRGQSNYKTRISEAAKAIDALILHLAPHRLAGGPSVCALATLGCMLSCLFTAGRAGIIARGKRTNAILQARIRRTRYYFANRAAFLTQAEREICVAAKRAELSGRRLAVRVNGTSDLPGLAMHLAAAFPSITFYDYTKLPKPWLRERPNYRLTFSLSETNLADALDALAHGVNVAVVFDTRRTAPLPATWHGYPVIDGDAHDFRFLDPRGVVVGLRAKGRARRDTSGFVVRLAA
jgi:hypothetical protein